MSELTMCNHCRLLRIKADAKRKGLVVIMARGKKSVGTFGNGTDIHVVNKKGEELNDNNFVSWMALIPKNCEC